MLTSKSKVYLASSYNTLLGVRQGVKSYLDTTLKPNQIFEFKREGFGQDNKKAASDADFLILIGPAMTDTDYYFSRPTIGNGILQDYVNYTQFDNKKTGLYIVPVINTDSGTQGSNSVTVKLLFYKLEEIKVHEFKTNESRKDFTKVAEVAIQSTDAFISELKIYVNDLPKTMQALMKVKHENFIFQCANKVAEFLSDILPYQENTIPEQCTNGWSRHDISDKDLEIKPSIGFSVKPEELVGFLDINKQTEEFGKAYFQKDKVPSPWVEPSYKFCIKAMYQRLINKYK